MEEYSLKFTFLYKYGPSLVSTPKDDMSMYVIGVSTFLKDECYMTMLHDDMNISRLMVYVQSIEESKFKRRGTEVTRDRPDKKFNLC